MIRRGAVAVYSFTSASKNRDVSSYVNPPATFVGVYYTRGPDNHPQGALSFRGTRKSYVLIPNNGCLDTRYSLTIIMWVYPESSGPLLHFNPKGWGLHLWIINRYRLFARFVPRSGKSVKALYKRIKPRRWNYIAATYDRRTGLASLWLDSLPIIQRRVGRFRSGLATNYPIVIGSKPGDRRKFRGKIACVQMYNYAMNGQQIRSKKKKCFREGLYWRASVIVKYCNLYLTYLRLINQCVFFLFPVVIPTAPTVPPTKPTKPPGKHVLQVRLLLKLSLK